MTVGTRCAEGFRADWTPAGSNSLTCKEDIYQSKYGETLTVPSLNAPYSNTFPNNGKYSGGNILGRWNHSSEGSSMSLQMYYDNTTIADNSLFVDHQNIFDMDFQDGFHLGNSQQFVVGPGLTGQSVTGTTRVSLFPCSQINSR